MDIAAHYLGGQAKLINIRVWGLPDRPSLRRRQEPWHHMANTFDLDDRRMPKFFFYLMPVDKGTGPYVYVRRSQSRAPSSTS
ncbi:hypothetical protein GCM10007880_62310 [Mesorhizobium amorphae]|nr:hypothetical protein GCM10007880_62310 [Mesorhizobium amorphae]